MFIYFIYLYICINTYIHILYILHFIHNIYYICTHIHIYEGSVYISKIKSYILFYDLVFHLICFCSRSLSLLSLPLILFNHCEVFHNTDVSLCNQLPIDVFAITDNAAVSGQCFLCIFVHVWKYFFRFDSKRWYPGRTHSDFWKMSVAPFLPPLVPSAGAALELPVLV